ncbi:pyridoxal 5'-phosphate synthase glutaminase subunit PdxT [Brevibacterium aurantiacum]|uniref:Pyridoxal 5'-phosphate synthase subunit PdxT n=1 Tax=Brevibacterium aurantiacum TaxID=273384 RepID=A0A556CMY5_BREAU|nr:pyridoxal 5'-phosphate synthase glutaminase subunit PdxT [Brevibacterium aurantiacum]TSI18804.1 pyridoxal 5'-phosphate synthase glutaminase subunit PdxT [Brevibacterium aurantiacum]
MRVGVLSLQGAFREHLAVLDSLGVATRKVTRPEHLENIDSIILPGGESSAMVRIAATTELFPVLGEKISAGLPVFGTCAGLILLADRLTDASLDGFDRLGGLDVTVARNAYGRQRESFCAPVQVTGLDGAFDATFIRAPQILDLGTGVEVLSKYAAVPVLVRQGNIWGGSFHPELGSDMRIHEEFLHSLGATV